MSSNKYIVFVYGTLKRNEPNYDLLTNKDNGVATFLGEAHTSVKYPLVIASRHNIPFVLDQPGTGNHVKGEVYEVDDDMLSKLDELEEYPVFYWREKIPVTLSDTQEQMEAWIYLLKSFKPELLKLPYYIDYSSSGSHGLVYRERKDRIPGYEARPDVQDVTQ